MTIGVVTTAWNGYARFLPEWLASITDQTVPPAMVTVWACGDDVASAHRTLADTTARVVAGAYRGMGAARNAAVEATPCEWVMHLDADDLLLPNALADITALTEKADVVSVGMLRDGREITFPNVSSRTILRGRQGTFSCAAFRRSLWEQRPWITRNDWVDSAFWVGLAHLGARFVGTHRPGAVYRQHADSYSRRLTGADRVAARKQWRRLCRRWQ